MKNDTPLAHANPRIDRRPTHKRGIRETTPHRAAHRPRCIARKGSAYILVLSAAMLMTMLGLTGLASMRLVQRSMIQNTDLTHARQHARDALDLAMYWIEHDVDFRTTFPHGEWIENQPLGNGYISIDGRDQTDNDLDNRYDDPITIRGYGRQGEAISILQMTVLSFRANLGQLEQQIKDDEPVAYWKLQDDGNAAVDEMGTVDGLYHDDAHGTDADGYLCERVGRFDGKEDCVEIAHDEVMHCASGTIVFWFKADKLGGVQGLFSKDSQNYDNGGHIHIELKSKCVEVRLQSHNHSYTLKSDKLDEGQWYAVAMRFGSVGMALYIDGEQVDTDSYTGGLDETSGGSGNTEPLVLAAGTTTSDDGSVEPLREHFEGSLVHVAFFDKVLDDETIETYYELGLPVFVYDIERGSIDARSN